LACAADGTIQIEAKTIPRKAEKRIVGSFQ